MYRNYHASITLASGEVFDRSVFVADIGEGTKRAGRELVRAAFAARQVRLHSARMVEAPRKGCLVISATATRKQRALMNRAVKARKAADLVAAA